jgi:hypothetical protein
MSAIEHERQQADPTWVLPCGRRDKAARHNKAPLDRPQGRKYGSRTCRKELQLEQGVDEGRDARGRREDEQQSHQH